MATGVAMSPSGSLAASPTRTDPTSTASRTPRTTGSGVSRRPATSAVAPAARRSRRAPRRACRRPCRRPARGRPCRRRRRRGCADAARTSAPARTPRSRAAALVATTTTGRPLLVPPTATTDGAESPRRERTSRTSVRSVVARGHLAGVVRDDAGLPRRVCAPDASEPACARSAACRSAASSFSDSLSLVEQRGHAVGQVVRARAEQARQLADERALLGLEAVRARRRRARRRVARPSRSTTRPSRVTRPSSPDRLTCVPAHSSRDQSPPIDDDPHLVAVLLAEQRHRAERPRASSIGIDCVGDLEVVLRAASLTRSSISARASRGTADARPEVEADAARRVLASRPASRCRRATRAAPCARCASPCARARSPGGGPGRSSRCRTRRTSRCRRRAGRGARTGP